MTDSRVERLIFVAVAACAFAASGCMEPGEPVYGESLTDEPFEVYDPMVGIHPSERVLEDPNNPYALAYPGLDARFDIEAQDTNNVAAFYSWASVLTDAPTGEHQFYAATNLAEIWEAGNASQEDLPVVREMAIAAYQNVLTYFPDSATFDETGTIAFELATPAYQGIVALGGTPEGGWIIVEDQQGIPRAVRQ